MQLVGASYNHLTVALLVLSATITCLNAAVYLNLIVSSTMSNLCTRGDVGLISTSIQVQSRVTQGTLTVSDWNTLTVIDPQQGYNGTLDIPFDESSTDGIQLRLLQLEHGGGNCNCWKMEDATIFMGNSSTSIDYCSEIVTGFTFPVVFCDGTATEARGIISQAIQLPVSETATGTCPGESNTLIESKGNPLPETCTTPRIEVSYTLVINAGDHCLGPIGEQESIEFSMRTELSSVWIPIILTEHISQSRRPRDTTERVVRGYSVKVNRQSSNDFDAVPHEVTICGEALLPANASEVQFRWVNTALGTPKVWAIWSATANYINSYGNIVRIFNTSDESSSPWQAIRNGGINCSICDHLQCALTYFGNSPANSVEPQTNIALTRAMSIVSFLKTTSVPSPETSSAPSAETSTSEPSAETSTSESSAEISTSEPSAETSTSEPSAETSTSEPSAETNTSASSAETSSPSRFAILKELYSILDELSMTINRDLGIKLVELALQVATDEGSSAFEMSSDVIGSSLLHLVDSLALIALQDEDNIAIANKTVFIETRLITADVEGYITTINSEDYSHDLPLMSTEIPSELVELFAGSSGGDERVVRVISALYYDVEHLFPGERPGENNSSVLGSGIVSTGLQCGESLCDTTGINLLNPVVITIEHSKEKNDVISECVFWEFLAKLENTSLTSGQWSNNGCYRNAELSNRSLTVCECYHLTHFAILLSPVPLKLNEQVVVSLQAIGYVGVTVSVVAMAITAITFISHKSLHNMRNYIHIHLCINLMIAQLVFVVGIDKSAEDHVPIHCQVIAVLLHYFFLVSFMWMLMEGVVLYFILIRVFVTNTKKYIIIFTLASYGIPLLYMGMVALPLGYVLKNQHYGSKSSCFLNAETHFMWAFIAPVILIILLNIGFLIMAAVALWRQKSQKGEMDRKSIVAWLKAVGFLVVVMGITWIVGLLVMEVEALLPLAYIFTTMVAFQGVAIFLSLVAFQKSVRDEYIKWFRRQKINKYFSKSSADTSTLTKKNEDNNFEDKEERV